MAAIPCHIAFSVSSTRSASAGSDPGASSGETIMEKAESPCHPARIAPQSTDRTSPARSTFGPGMPCTTSSLTEMQVVAGYGGRP